MPKYDAFGNLRGNSFKDHTGESRIMNNGMRATVVEYFNSKNMTVQFENGILVKEIKYGNFVRGEVKCPMILEYIDDYVKCINPVSLKSFLIDIDDIPFLEGQIWDLNEYGYAECRLNYKLVRLHRHILKPKKEEQVDHVSGDRADNRRKNLRLCIEELNHFNQPVRRSNNTSGHKGVRWDKSRNRWRVSIGVRKKVIYLGSFVDKEEAIKTYREASLKYYKEFSRLD
jgi:hypothetical protein